MKKTIKLTAIFFALSTFLFSLGSCMDGGYGEANTATAYGNDTITEHNVVKINDLMNATKSEYAKYKTAFAAQRGAELVTEDIQLKLRVIGNDLGGNIYNKVAMEDEDGTPIMVTVYASGLHSYLRVGQQIIVNMKGLYFGTYGYQRQIGVPYTTASGNTYAGRMPNFIWQQHFKLIGEPDASKVHIRDISDVQKNMTQYAGALVQLKGVEMRDANGSNTWADIPQNVKEDEENLEFSTTRFIRNYQSNTFVYTSTSAKFAGEVMPKGKLNITAIASRYGSDLQLLIRTLDDIEVAK